MGWFDHALSWTWFDHHCCRQLYDSLRWLSRQAFSIEWRVSLNV